MNKYKYKNKYVGGRRKYSNDEDSRTACDYMERHATCVGTTASQWGGMGDIAMLHFYLVCGIGSSSIPGGVLLVLQQYNIATVGVMLLFYMDMVLEV